MEGVSKVRCLRKPGYARRVLAEATYLRECRKSDTDTNSDYFGQQGIRSTYFLLFRKDILQSFGSP